MTLTPKEKAEELVEKCMSIRWDIPPEDGKMWALMQVQSLLEENESILKMLKVHGSGRSRLPLQIRISELIEVKQELEKL